MNRLAGYLFHGDSCAGLRHRASAREPRFNAPQERDLQSTPTTPLALPLFRAGAWSLVPAALGFSLHFFLAGRWEWGLTLLALSQLLIWPLAFLHRKPLRTPAEWIMILLGSGVSIGIACPGVLPWLLLPTLPAFLLRHAVQAGASLPIRPVMRIFSIALLAAVLTQAIATGTPPGILLALAGSTMFGLIALEMVSTQPVAPNRGR